MKIAITAENSDGLNSAVAQHFGRAPYFILVDVEKEEITETNAIPNPFAAKHEPGQVPDFIRDQGAKVMVSGGMGGRAIQFFEQAGIEVATGARGTVRQALEKFFGGELAEAAPCAESVEHGHG
ncbi:MAG: NifB/NifX family molybdenum-iron cluster-binding protein [Anaerolineae bacterium]|jgi:predicted Fe-Mo cluster-binding NifX family protein|nr:NifB/NifX family molybdenum-iron cluster-binding protein [Anaerolineae bacterium]MBT7189878.1 NifB/NifX family molybdenum-iron cluster-binding protein [Anaerolineae bacterium]MBT7991678.1 NifB/NifX family molybdenum-iron cluster-binding protein [Anaerolineae bacterium]